MNNRLRWILPIPILLFCAASWLFVRSENEALIQMTRAERAWRAENYRAAVAMYQAFVGEYPRSQYADDALWEIGLIHQINYNDALNALHYFTRLVKEYPSSPRLVDAYLKLAEIHEAELMDLPKAITFWSQALSLEHRQGSRRTVQFQIADAHFKLNQFDQAIQNFRLLLDGTGDDLKDRSRIRIATIFQIQKRYEESVGYFLEVIRTTHCVDCRRAARLGLIETYEFVGDLSRALELAQAIPVSEYSAEDKSELMRRLEEKQRYYTPSPRD